MRLHKLVCTKKFKQISDTEKVTTPIQKNLTEMNYPL